MKKSARAAIFVPHAGCPHRCVFCNQRRISGASAVPGERDITHTLAAAAEQLAGRALSAEIAFFGGSFTAIPREEMLRMLRAAQPFLGDASPFQGIRISTRPDAIDDEILDILEAHGVTAIELGAQSMDDRVLAACARGHSAQDVFRAAEKIRARGLSLGLQMMTGLPGDSDEGAIQTAQALAALRPDTLRIYPTLVLSGTPLAELFRAGAYRPPALDEAVALCARLLRLCKDRGIRVIRMGLQDEPSLRESLLAGPWHPAFRELAESAVLLEEALDALQGYPPGEVTLRVADGATSKMVGQRRANLRALWALGYRAKIVEDERVEELSVRLHLHENT